jgi:long-chain fatty acid transport protein
LAENTNTIFFNPAGKTQLKEREFSAGVAAVGQSFKFTDNGSSVDTLTGKGNGGDAMVGLRFQTPIRHGHSTILSGTNQ